MKPRLALTIAVAGVALAATACGSSDTDAGSSASSSSSTTSSSSPTTSDAMASGMVGAGCAEYAKAVPSGAGSVEGMSQDPVATAASNNPLLKTLTQAVSGKVNPSVDLVNTLNNGEFTVFAPVDDAFKKLPAGTVDTLAKEKGGKTLSSILTYHVIAGQLSPDQIVGTHKTVEGQDVEVKGSGDNLTVGADGAKVICGGVKTANATVYLIDSVLMPPKM
ncbi:fasciclin domain-containing protein [Angustibacter luteus]|uniref:Fasciclin domain-containing protein n=1 Tax=Angustibacter luteus TaxID=658456 RepID=A0ABW1JJF0_9ACTN